MITDGGRSPEAIQHNDRLVEDLVGLLVAVMGLRCLEREESRRLYQCQGGFISMCINLQKAGARNQDLKKGRMIQMLEGLRH